MNLFKINLSPLGVLLLLTFVGCSSASYVSYRPGSGGVIRVNPKDSEEARLQAEDLMRQTCAGKNYRIVEEGEAVIGKHKEREGNSYIEDTTRIFKKDSKTYRESGSSYDVTEWRLTFECY